MGAEAVSELSGNYSDEYDRNIDQPDTNNRSNERNEGGDAR